MTQGPVRNIDRRDIARLKEGDFAAFDRLFAKYSSRIFYFSLGYLKSKEDAEEVVQDVFLKIWEKRHSLDEELSFKAYLFTITFNSLKKIFLNAAKRETTYKELSEELGIQYSDPEYTPDYQVFNNMMNELINRLPERRKQIFIMSRIEGKPNELIAEELAVSLKTVENQISEAKRFLKENIKDIFPVLLFFLLFF